MPLTHAAPDALARTYAKALFELVMSQGGQAAAEATLGELETLLELARTQASFDEFLSSQILPAADRARSLKAIFGPAASPSTLNFLLVLNAKGRLGHLPPIVAAFDEMLQQAFGRIEVDVYTAAPASPAEIDLIKQRLRTILGKEPIVHPYTDKSMLGGLKLQIGDQLIDASLATRLRRMRDKLTTSGLASLRAHADRILSDPSNN
jgi:F-type H+-transporting ATPase subunit delta